MYIYVGNMYVCLRMGENTSGIRPADHSVRDRHTVIICIVNTQLTKYVRQDTRTHRVIVHIKHGKDIC